MMAVERLSRPGDDVWTQWSADHLARYQFAIDYIRGKTVLDSGTGIGYGAAMLKAAGAARVDGIDIDAGAIAQAQREFGSIGVHFAIGDSENLQATSPPYEVICSFENIEHLHDPEAFLSSAAKALKPEGILLCSTPDRSQSVYVNGRPSNPFHVREWYRDDFRKLLLNYFGHVDVRIQVKSHWLAQRQEAAGFLQEAIYTYDRAMRGILQRGIAKVVHFLLQRRPEARPWHKGKLRALAAASPADYPVVDESLAGLYGDSFCHVAVCREPSLKSAQRL